MPHFRVWKTGVGAYDLQIQIRARFLYNAQWLSFIILCLMICVDKQTDAAENTHLALL